MHLSMHTHPLDNYASIVAGMLGTKTQQQESYFSFFIG